MDRNIILAAALGIAASLLIWYVMKERNHFVSTTYGTSCMQICSMAHPKATEDCYQNSNNSKGTDDCKMFNNCIEECRMDQAKLKQEATTFEGIGSSSWEGPYGKLL